MAPPITTRYYIQLTLPSASNIIIFTGFFDVDDTTHIVQTFYDSTNPTVDIRSTGSSGGPTYLYYPGWLCFDGGGCNVTSFPYLYGATSGDYNMYGVTTSSTNNHVDSLVGVTYAFSLTPFNGGNVACFKEGSMILGPHHRHHLPLCSHRHGPPWPPRYTSNQTRRPDHRSHHP